MAQPRGGGDGRRRHRRHAVRLHADGPGVGAAFGQSQRDQMSQGLCLTTFFLAFCPKS